MEYDMKFLQSKPFYCLKRFLTIAVVLAIVSSTHAIADSSAEATATHQSIFALYEENRKQGIPNHITADLALVSYSLLRQNSIHVQEERQIIPRFSAFLDELEQALGGQQSAFDPLPGEALIKQAQQANHRLVQLAQALMQPGRVEQLDDSIRAEYQRIVNADTVMESPLWGRKVDYTQYKPRGRYTRDEQAERFFRAFRYLSGQWFAVKPSMATGISDGESHLQTAQLAQLVQLINDNEVLRAQRQELEAALDWQFGPAEDLRDRDVIHVLQHSDHDDDFPALADALFNYAVKQQRQPSVIDAVVELNFLESDVKLQDVLSGWRLIPSRLSVQSSFQQSLMYHQTGDYTGDASDLPFGYGIVNGHRVKAYPAAGEWLALIGGEAIQRVFLQTNEAQFKGYKAAFESSYPLLKGLTGAEQLHTELLRTGLESLNKDPAIKDGGYLDAQTLNGFQTWQKFLEVLYSKQSYTPSAKGLMIMTPERHTASLDIATDLYTMLAHAARLQWQRTALVEWQAFSEIMSQLVDISATLSYGGILSKDNISYLNHVDKKLLSLTGSSDEPVVVDIHTNPNEDRVVQHATGYARVVTTGSASDGVNRGARLSFYEFKQPMAERMTVDEWQAQLVESHVLKSEEEK